MIDKDYAPKKPSTWVTVISEYNGFISTRDIGPYDTTIYADREIAAVPWLPGDKGPDHHGISLEMEKLGKEWLY